MSEASGNPLDDKPGIGETITTALRHPSFLRVVLLLAALVVVFVGMRLAAPILDPILFAVVLALAEHGVTSAVLVVAGVTVINILAENALSPMLMGRGLSISPTVLFIGFIFWAWLLGGPGAFLAAPLTIFLILMLDTFPETRWLANVMGMGAPEPDAPEPDAPDPEEPAIGPTERPSVSP
jgi:AI-2 transport protein TqsA